MSTPSGILISDSPGICSISFIPIDILNQLGPYDACSICNLIQFSNFQCTWLNHGVLRVFGIKTELTTSEIHRSS